MFYSCPAISKNREEGAKLPPPEIGLKVSTRFTILPGVSSGNKISMNHTYMNRYYGYKKSGITYHFYQKWLIMAPKTLPLLISTWYSNKKSFFEQNEVSSKYLTYKEKRKYRFIGSDCMIGIVT